MTPAQRMELAAEPRLMKFAVGQFGTFTSVFSLQMNLSISTLFAGIAENIERGAGKVPEEECG